MNSMSRAKIGTASTKAANSKWSWATIQMATRLPILGTARYSASSYGLSSSWAAASSALAARSASAWSRGVSISAVCRIGDRNAIFSSKVVTNFTDAVITATIARTPRMIGMTGGLRLFGLKSGSRSPWTCLAPDATGPPRSAGGARRR